MKVSDIDLAKKYLQKEKNARKRGIDFSLSLARMKQLCEQERCSYTGWKFSSKIPGRYLTLDRVDNNKGYTDENTVACCYEANVMKGALSLPALLEICRVALGWRLFIPFYRGYYVRLSKHVSSAQRF